MRSAHERELDRLVTQLKFKEQLVKQLEGKLIKLTTPPSTASSMTSRVGGLVGTTTNMTVETPPKSPGELGHVSILSNLNLNAGPSVAPPPPHPSSTTNKFITAKSFGTFRKPSALVSKGGNGHLSQQHKRQRRNIPQQKQLQQQQQQHGDGDDMMMYDDDSLMNDNDDPSTTVIDNSNNHNHFNTTSSIDDKSATTTTASNIGGGVLVAQTPPIVHVKSKAIQVENLLDHPQRGDHHDDNDGCGGRGNGDSNTEEQVKHGGGRSE